MRPAMSFTRMVKSVLPLSRDAKLAADPLLGHVRNLCENKCDSSILFRQAELTEIKFKSGIDIVEELCARYAPHAAAEVHGANTTLIFTGAAAKKIGEDFDVMLETAAKWYAR